MNDELNQNDKQLLREVHQAIVGNPEMGHEGLVHRVDRHDRWIMKADLKIARTIGGAIAAGAIVSGLAWAIEQFFHK